MLKEREEGRGNGGRERFREESIPQIGVAGLLYGSL